MWVQVTERDLAHGGVMYATASDTLIFSLTFSLKLSADAIPTWDLSGEAPRNEGKAAEPGFV